MTADELRDRELLELAAKAAGYEFGEINGAVKARIEQDIGTCGTYGCQKHQWRDWNPLTDDGDALRLTVKLGGELLIHTEEHWSAFGMIYSDKGMFEYHNGDPYAATRRAIVRAAAKIGRSMK